MEQSFTATQAVMAPHGASKGGALCCHSARVGFLNTNGDQVASKDPTNIYTMKASPNNGIHTVKFFNIFTSVCRAHRLCSSPLLPPAMDFTQTQLTQRGRKKKANM
jgi:hypothetical protein